MLIIMAGLPATGKSTLATELVRRTDAVILSKDVVRHSLFPQGLIEYSTEQDDFVTNLLLQTARYIWGRHPDKTIILDGRTFSRASQRKHVIEFAVCAGQQWRIVECVCDDEVAKARLSQPDPTHPAGNRTPDLYAQVKARWEPIEEEYIAVRTDHPIHWQELLRELVS